MPDTDITCSEGACIVEVNKATAELLKQSFILVKNEKRLQVRNVYAQPKVAVMKASTLDQAMGSQCSMSTKSNDRHPMAAQYPSLLTMTCWVSEKKKGRRYRRWGRLQGGLSLENGKLSPNLSHLILDIL